MSIVAFFYNFSGSGFFAAQEGSANRFSFCGTVKTVPYRKAAGL